MTGALPVEPAAEPYILAGRYQLLGRIGEGGMGIVWRCFDLDLEEPVAIKFLREDLASDATLRASFRGEVKLARRVTHPNVARVFEFGREGDLYFLTMEFIEGESLDSVLARDGRLSERSALSLGTSLCRGLAAAHAAGVIHGDLKPGNVLIDRERGAVLTDFGIARALSEAQGRHERARGTLEYMPPEQLEGAGSSLQSDIYAMGIVFLELLTGRTPWSGRSQRDVLVAKLDHDESAVRALASGLPREWVELISDCVRSDPRQRPADARALLRRVAALRCAVERRRPSQATPVDAAGAPGRPRPAPLASGSWPKWIEVVPFEAHERTAEQSVSQLTGDLVDALTQVRGLRVAASGVDPNGPPIERRTLIRGEVIPTDSGELTVAVRVLDTDEEAPHAEFVVHRSRAALGDLGRDLATRIVAAIDPPQAERLPAHTEKLDDVAATLHAGAKEASAALRLDDSVRLYEKALARAPGHPALRVEHTLARARQLFSMCREVSPDERAGLRAAVEEVVREFGEFGEPHLAAAIVALAQDDAVGAARSARAALARAPNLVDAHVLLADVLLDIGRLPDAGRRLDVAIGLDCNSVLAWTSRARLAACQGLWHEFDGMVDGTLAQLGHRSVELPRLMLWQPDRAALRALEPVFVGNVDRLPPPLCALGRELIAFGLACEDRRAIFDRLARHPGFSHPRHDRFLAEVLCELACMLGDLERARDMLARADRHVAFDWYWIDQCPALAPLRRDPLFAELRERVRINADAVAEAVWG